MHPSRQRAISTAAFLALSALLLSSGLAAAQSITLAPPTSSTTYVDSLSVSYSITGDSSAQSVKVRWTLTSSTDRPDLVNTEWVLTYRTPSLSQTVTLTPNNFASAVCASSPCTWSTATPSTSMPEGFYSVKAEYVRPASAGSLTVTTTTRTNVYLDLKTMTPTLTSPATNAALSSSMVVQYTLPEFYLSGSAQLVFSNASNTVTVNLVDNVLNASFSFSTASISNPTYIQSASPTSLPDGTYTVTLKYQDRFSHAVASAAATNVVIRNATPAPSITYPLASTDYGGQNPLAAVAYTIPVTPAAGTVTLAISPGAYSFTLPNLSGAQTYAVPTTIPDGTYSLALSYRDSLMNPTATTTNSGVKIKRNSLAPSLTSPADSASVNTAHVAYTLAETPLSGGVKLRLVGSTTTGTITLADAMSGDFSLDLLSDPHGLSSSVATAADFTSLPDGTYAMTLLAQDVYSNAAAASVTRNVRVQAATSPFSVTYPEAGKSYSEQVPIAYALSETAAAGSVTVTFDGPSHVVFTMIDTSPSGTHYIQAGQDPSGTSPFVSAVSTPSGQWLVEGEYDVTFAYQNLYGSAPASTTIHHVSIAAPKIAIVASASVNESAGTVDIPVTLTGTHAFTSSVNYAMTDGTAIAGTNYYAPSGTLTWAGGDNTTQYITVPVVDDSIDTAALTATVTLSSPTNATFVQHYLPNGTLTDEDDCVLTIADADTPAVRVMPLHMPMIVIEDGGTDGFMVMLMTQPAHDVEVTPHGGTLLGLSPATLTFTSADWNTPQTVTVTGPPVGEIEAGQTVAMTFSVASSDPGYSGLPVPSVDVMIWARPTLSIGSLSESESGTFATVPVTLTGSHSDTVTVTYATSDGTAVDGVNYTGATGVLTWTPTDAATQEFHVPVIDDQMAAGNLTVNLSLSSPTNAKLGQSSGVLTVTDTQTASVVLSPAHTPTVVDEGQGTDSFDLVLSSQPTADVVVTPIGGSYLGMSPATLTFTASNWNTPQTVTVSGPTLGSVSADQVVYASFGVASSDPHYDGYLISPLQVQIKQRPSLSVGSTTVLETTSSIDIGVTLTGTHSDIVTVHYATSDVTASSANYTATSGTLTWSSGEVGVKNFSIAIANDHVATGDLTVDVTLSSPTHAKISQARGSLTIVDTQSAHVVLIPAQTPTVVNEGGGTDTFSVVLTSQPTHDVVVTPQAGTLLGLAPSALTFTSANWSTPQTVTLTGPAYGEVGAGQTIALTLDVASADDTYDGTAVTPLDVQIALRPTISIGALSVSETGTSASVPVTLSGSHSDSVTVSYATSDGTATSGINYTSASGVLTWGPGDTTAKSFLVPVFDDLIEAGNLTVDLSLSSATNAKLGRSSAELTIIDTQSASVVLSAAHTPAVVSEGGGSDTFSLVLSSQPTASVVVTPNGGSYLGVTPAAITFTTSNWSTPQTVTLVGPALGSVTADQVVYASFTVASADPNYDGHLIAPLEVDITARPSISIGVSSVSETAGAVNIPVTLSGTHTDTVTVHYATSDGSASSANYTATSGTLTWSSGETGAKNFSIPVLDDHVASGNLTVDLTLSSPTNAKLGQASGVLTITDTQTASVVLTPAHTPTQVKEGGGTDGFTVVLGSQPTHDVVITPAGGTLLGLAPSSLTFTASDWNTPQTVTITGPAYGEIGGSQTVAATLSVASSDARYDGIAVTPLAVNIVARPTLSIGSLSVSETGTSVTVPVTLTGSHDDAVTVAFATSDGTAVGGVNYTARSGVLSWAASDTSPKTFVVPVFDDHVKTGNLSVDLTLSSPTNAKLGQAFAVLTVADTQSASVALSPAHTPTAVSEGGGTDSFSLVLSSQPTASVVVTPNGGSYLGMSPVAITFTTSNWSTPQTVTITGPALGSVATDQVLYASFSVASSDLNYDGYVISPLAVAVTARPSISIASGSVSELAGGISIPATLSGAHTDTVTVQYVTSDGSASSANYTAGSGTLTWTSGEVGAKGVWIPILDDHVAAGNLTVEITLSSPTNAKLDQASGVLTITDTQTASVVLTPAHTPTTVSEGGGTDTFTVALGSQPTSDVVITPGGGTLLGLAPSSLTFTAADWSTPQTVTITGPAYGEIGGGQTVAATLSVSSTDARYGAIVVPPLAVNIVARPTLSIGSLSVSEMGTSATVPVTLTGSHSDTVTVTFATSDGTAADGVNYTAATGVLSWGPGDTAAKTFVVPVFDDQVRTGNLTVALTLSSPTNAKLGQASGILTLGDTQSASVVLSAAHTPTVVSEGGGTDTFTLVLSSRPTANVVVTPNGGSYLGLSPAPITFTSSSWSAPQTVTIQGPALGSVAADQLVHASFAVASSDANYDGYVISPLAVSIAARPSISIGSSAVSETAGSVSIPVTLSGAHTDTVTVHYATSDGSASSANYTSASGTLTWSSGEVGAKSFSIPIVDDHVAGGPVTVELTLSSPTNAKLAQANGVLTISDTQTASVVLSAAHTPTLVSEGGGTDSFTLVLSSQPTSDVVVTPHGGTLLAFSPSPLTFTSSTWSTPQTVTITGPAYGEIAGSQTIAATLSVASSDPHYDAVAVTALDVTIEARPTLSIGSLSVSETETSATVPVTLTGSHSDSVTVTFATSDGTALAGVNYTTATGVLTWVPGDTAAKTFAVPVFDDHVKTGNLSVDLTLSSPTNAKLGQASGVLTLGDTQSASVVLSAAHTPTRVSEGGGTDSFTLVLSSQPTADVVVTPNAGSYLAASPTPLTFTTSNWNTPQTVTVTGPALGSVAADQVVYASFAVASGDLNYDGYVIRPIAVEIAARPSISIGSSAVSEAAGSVSIPVTLSGAHTDTVTVQYATSDGSASSANYTATSGTLTWTSGELGAKSFVVPVLDDHVAGGPLTVTLTLSSPTNAKLGQGSALLTITDTQTASVVLSAAHTPTMVSEGGGTDSFTLVLSSQPSADVVVTSVGGSYLSLSPNPVTFTPSDWSTPQTVTVTGPELGSVNGTQGVVAGFIVDSSDPNYDRYVIAPLRVNINARPTLSIRASAVSETAGVANIPVTLSGAHTDTVSVQYATSDGSASAANYTSASGTLTWASGEEGAKSFAVPVLDDHVAGGNVTVHLTLSTPINAKLGQASSVLTITDTQTASVVLSATHSPTVVSEGGGTDSFTLVLGSQPTSDVVITPRAGTLLAFSPSPLTFTAGDWSTPQTVTVTGPADGEIASEHTVSTTLDVVSTDPNYDRIAVTPLDVTIETRPTLSIGSLSVSETGTSATVPVTLTGTHSNSVSVAYATSDGTAAAGVNYAAATGVLSWDPSDNAPKTFAVPVFDDHVQSGNLTVNLGLSSPTNAKLGQASAVLTVADTQTASVVLTAAHTPLRVSEGGGTDTFSLVLSSQPTADVVVTPSGGSYLGVTPGALTFTASDWSTPQIVTIAGPALGSIAADQVVYASVSVASSDAKYDGYVVAPLEVAIAQRPTVAIGSSAVAETAGVASVPVTLSGAHTDTVTVDYATSDGSASSANYLAASGTLTWASGEVGTKTFAVPVLDDHVASGNVTVHLTLSTPVNTKLGQASGELTITDTQTASVVLSPAHTPTLVSEGGGSDSFSVVLGSQPTHDVVITPVAGTLLAFSPSPLTFTAADWSTPQTVTITGPALGQIGASQTVSTTLNVASADPNYAHAAVPALDVRVALRPTVSIGSLAVSETGGSATVPVTLIGNHSDTVTVEYSVSDGTASASVNYSATSGVLSWGPGDTTARTFSVPVFDDHSETGNLTANLSLAAATNAKLGQAAGVLTIGDVQTASVVVSAGHTPLVVSEGGGSDDFSLALSSQPAADVVVALSAGGGLGLTPALLTFTPGNWSTPQTVTVAGPSLGSISDDHQALALFSVTSSDAFYDGLSVAPLEIVVRQRPMVSIGSIAVSETAGSVNIPVSLSGVPAETVSVQYATTDGTASAANYTSVSGTLSWNAGEFGVQTFAVPVLDDHVAGGSVTVRLTLSSPTGAKLGQSSALLTVGDSQSANVVLAAAHTPTQVSEGGGTDTFTVVLSSQPTANVVVTPNGGSYLGMSPPALTFTPGNWSAPQTVTVAGPALGSVGGDQVVYASFSVASSDPNYGGHVVSPLEVDITQRPTLSIASSAVSETAGSASIPVTLSGAHSDPVTVHYATSDGSASGANYTPASGTLTWSSGELGAKSFSVPVSNDHVARGTLTVQLTLSAPSNAKLGVQSGVLAITDTQSASVVLTPAHTPTRLDEGKGQDTFTLQLSSQPTSDVVVTPSGGTLLRFIPSSVTFTASNWSTPQTVAIIGPRLGAIGASATVATTFSVASDDPAYSGLLMTPLDVEILSHPTISLGSMAVSEAAGGAVVPVTLSGAHAGTVSVDYATTAGTAEEGVNFTASSGTLSWGPNDTTPRSFNVPVFDDHVRAGNLSVNLLLARPTNANLGQAAAILTVNDTQTQSVVLSAAHTPTTAHEGGGSDSFALVLSAPPTADVVVSASGGLLLQLQPSSVTFSVSDWSTPRAITVTGPALGAIDDDQLAHVSFSVASEDLHYNAQNVSPLAVEIKQLPIVSIGSSSVSESAGSATVEVSLSGEHGDTATVYYATTDGTATSANYTSVTGMLSWNPGEVGAKQFSVPVLDDEQPAGSLTVDLTLSGATNAKLGQSSGVLTISDDQTPSVEISPARTPTKVSDGGGTDSFTVALGAPPTEDVLITPDGGSLLIFMPAQLIFTAENWSSPQLVTISVGGAAVGGAVADVSTSFAVTSADLRYDSLGVAPLAVRIDRSPSLFIASVVASETDDMASIPVQLSGMNPDGASVHYATSDGSALAGANYASSSGVLSWGAGETGTKTFAVPLIDDHTATGNRVVALALSSPTHATLGEASAILTIVDTDSPSIIVTPAHMPPRVQEGSGTDSLSVVLGSRPTSAVTITASAGSLVTFNPTALTFTPANWNKAQIVTVTGPEAGTLGADQTVFASFEVTSDDPVYAAYYVRPYDIEITHVEEEIASGPSSCSAAPGASGSGAWALCASLFCVLAARRRSRLRR